MIYICTDLLHSLAYTAPHVIGYKQKPIGTKLKIGFSSMFFREHASGKMIQGIIANLPRDLFHVTIIAVKGVWVSSCAVG